MFEACKTWVGGLICNRPPPVHNNSATSVLADIGRVSFQNPPLQYKVVLTLGFWRITIRGHAANQLQPAAVHQQLGQQPAVDQEKGDNGEPQVQPPLKFSILQISNGRVGLLSNAPDACGLWRGNMILTFTDMSFMQPPQQNSTAPYPPHPRAYCSETSAQSPYG